LEREVKEAKADALRASTECAEMKTTLAEFQTKTNEALAAMVANTGGKGSNTQWVHAEYIVITVNK
jgi:hypothetical protein